MTTPSDEPVFTLPSTPAEAKAMLSQMVTEGLLTAEDLAAELSAARSATSSGVSRVMEGENLQVMNEAPSPVSSVGSAETVSEKPVSFAEAVQKLGEAGFDLEKARTEAVGMHQQWGLVRALQAKGIVKDADEYGALFDNATFTPKGLQQLTQRLQQGEEWLPLFNPGHLKPRELWHVLFTKGRIPYVNDTYGFKHMDEMKKIAPGDIPGLAKLHNKSYDEQIGAFQEAYKKAYALDSGSPTILFTPDALEVQNVNKSATKHVQAALQGAQFTDPMGDWLRWRTQYQLTDQKPDTNTATQYPLYIFENGGVAGFDWFPEYVRLYLYDCYPDFAYDSLGPRAVLR